MKNRSKNMLNRIEAAHILYSKEVVIKLLCHRRLKQRLFSNFAGNKNSWNLDDPVHQDPCYLLEALAEEKVEDEV